MLRLEVRNASVPIEKKPSWIKTTARMGPEYRELQQLVKDEDLHTVCQEAGCPNIFECWEDREATFLIGGDQCTRRCDFCQIDTGKPADFDAGEPLRVAESVQKMGLRYATVTGVCRDDLPDEGAWLYAETIRQIHELNPGVGVEMLAPDFSGNLDYLGQLFEAGPEVFAHNVETVPRIFKRIRPGFRYDRSLDVLRASREAGLVTKSNLILGMGETREEVSEALRDLHDAGTEIITITQYLRPSPRHHPVERWVKPEEFVELPDRGRRDRLRRGDERPAGPLLLPRRTAVSSGRRVPRRPRTIGCHRNPADRATPPRPTDEPRGSTAMASQAGKEAKAQQKAAKRRRRPASKARSDPADMGRFKQIQRAYQVTHEHDKALPLPAARRRAHPRSSCSLWRSVCCGASRSTLAFLGIMVGILAAMLVLVQRAKKATFKRYAGQAGSAEVALADAAERPWVSTPVITANRQMDAVHRTLGPGGLVLIGEGEPGRLKPMLAGEVKKHERVAYGVPVIGSL